MPRPAICACPTVGRTSAVDVITAATTTNRYLMVTLLIPRVATRLLGRGLKGSNRVASEWLGTVRPNVVTASMSDARDSAICRSVDERRSFAGRPTNGCQLALI